MKTRKMKRFATIAAIAMIASCVAMPMAATMTVSAYNITVGTAVDDGVHTYEAYQVFAGTLDLDGFLTSVVWGSGVNTTAEVDGKTLLQAVQALKNGDATPFKDATNASDVARILSEQTESKKDDPAFAQAFADVVGKYLSTTKKTITSSTAATGVDAGYYLIQDAVGSPVDGEDAAAKTRYILKVVKDVEIVPKSVTPSVEKKVYENVKKADESATHEAETELHWNDVADYSIGDIVPFKLYATLPSSFTGYEAYYLKFTDSYNATAFDYFTDDNHKLVVKVNGTDVTDEKFNVHVNTATDGTVEVVIEDVIALGAAAGSVVTVEYFAELTDGAQIGLNGQMNAVYLEYSNNPNLEYAPSTGNYSEEEKENPNNTDDNPNNDELIPEKPDTTTDDKGTPETGDDVTDDNTGKTPEDKVIVFTYELDITKYLGTKSPTTTANDQENTRAGFKLMAVDGDHANMWATFDAATGKVTGWVADEGTATQLFTNSNGVIKFVGLDDGTYTVKETTVPKNYNPIDPITLKVVADTENYQEWNEFDPADALLSLKLYEKGETEDKLVNTADAAKNDIVNHDVVNVKGATLPSTGGIGTTIFYVVGGTMAAGAGVYLISKKRMKKDEE